MVLTSYVAPFIREYHLQTLDRQQVRNSLRFPGRELACGYLAPAITTLLSIVFGGYMKAGKLKALFISFRMHMNPFSHPVYG